MEKKKNPDVDFREKRPMFLFIGLTISLALTLMAFETKQVIEAIPFDCKLPVPNDYMYFEEVPPTSHKEPQPPPPPKVAVKQTEVTFVEVSEIVEFICYFPDATDDIRVPEIAFEELPPEIIEEPIVIAEFAAAFPGGNKSWNQFLTKNLKYPRKAMRMGIEGKVFLSFIVDKSGIISDIEVIRGIGAGCDEEAKRVLSKSPPWTPGIQRGRAVKTRMSLQVIFKLK